MGGPVLISALFHGIAVGLLYVGLPHLNRDEAPMERIVIVELLTLNEERNLREQVPEALVTREEQRPPEAAPPPPAPPLPSPTSVNRQVAPLPPKNSMSKISAPPPPKPNSVVEKERPEKQARVYMPDDVRAPIQKPDPPFKPDPFASVLKSVEEFEVPHRQTPEPDPKKDKPAPPIDDPLERILARADGKYKPDVPLSMTELDNIRYQIQKNWNLPAGGRNAHNMVVALRIRLGPDGTVLDVSVVDRSQMNNDPFYRAMAESTVRAVLKTGQIRNLSPEKYHIWRDMKINFDPKEMFG